MNERNSNKLVFVIDDDYPSFQLIEELFSGLHVNLKYFSSGHNLMESFSGGDFPDLIIMDIQLPGVDGLELTKQIKAIEPSIPVIAYTSCAMPGDRDRCLESGCDQYISKPIDIKGFLETVIGFLGK
jgi:two-component system, cell cycle response regulator DivK